MKAILKSDVSSKTGRSYQYVSLTILLNGKEVELKRVFLDNNELLLLSLVEK